MPVTNIVIVEPGIVKNLQRTTYYLRIPTETPRKDRLGRTLAIASNQAVELDYREWKLVEYDLITKDRAGILKIIKYPKALTGGTTINVYISYGDLPPNPPVGTLIWAQWGYYQGLFYWDSERNEWLSENQLTRAWSSASDSTAIEVGLVSNSDDTHGDNDVISHVPITITTMAGSQVNPLVAGSSTKFSINMNEIATGTVTKDVANITLSTAGERGVVNGDLNFPINGGVILSAVRLGTGEKITRPSMTLWYRERLAP